MNWNWLPTKAAVLNGMKALPLTIVLTVLIWMYAESQFTATEDAGMGGSTLVLQTVPLWVSAPPGVLADYRIEPRVMNVQITVGGSDAKIRELKAALDAGRELGIHGSLGVTDNPVAKVETEASGGIEYVLPEGIVLRDGPRQGEYVLHRRAAGTVGDGLEKYRKLAGELGDAIAKSAGGAVNIPASMDAEDVVQRRAFVTSQAGAKAVLFPTWRGKGSNLRGYLWVTGSAASFSSTTVGGRTTVKIWVPAPTESGVFLGAVTISPTADGNWFQAVVNED